MTIEASERIQTALYLHKHMFVTYIHTVSYAFFLNQGIIGEAAYILFY